MSMTCFIEVENDIIKLKQYPAIEKISELTNRIIKNGVDHGYDSPEIEISYGGKTYEMDILKFNRSKSVDVFEFFDHYLKKKICSYLLSIQRTARLWNFIWKKDKQIDGAGYSLKTRKKTIKIIF